MVKTDTNEFKVQTPIIKMEKEITHIAMFNGRTIRRVWRNNEWFYSIRDIVSILTDSDDPKQYIKKMRQRDLELKLNWGTICTLLESIGKDNKKRVINCSNKQGILRLIQSIPSKKAEPFKLWLAKVGSERIDEIENPELAQERMKQLYELKGYSKDWIEKRLRGIAIRQELTDEWKHRGIAKDKEFAILTNEISKAAFGKTVEEYKELKKLKRENLRDHMDDLELIFSMLGEASTTRIAKSKDSRGFDENKTTARQGGEVAGNARKELESKTNESVLSEDNFLEIPEKKKKKRKIQIKYTN